MTIVVLSRKDGYCSCCANGAGGEKDDGGSPVMRLIRSIAFMELNGMDGGMSAAAHFERNEENPWRRM